MRHVITSFFVVTVLAAAPLAATGTQAEKSTPAATEGKSVTITGCLREVADKPGLFVIVRSSGEMRAEAGQPTTPSAGTGSGHIVYRLTESGVDFKAHVGHTVQVSGFARAQPTAKAGKVPATLTSADVMGTPELSVKSIQHISETCPAPSK